MGGIPIFTEKAPRPIGPYSQAIKAGKFLFIAGQIPVDPATNEVVEGDIKVQTKRVLENIKAILMEAGYTLSDVVSIFVFLRDLNDFKEFNKVYTKYFVEKPPARTTVQVADLPKGVKLEISAIAYKD